MKKIIDWLKDGGGKFIGYDNSGDRMYSPSNGEALMLWLVCGAGVVLFFYMIYLFTL